MRRDGPRIDPVLTAELESPGSDGRCGVSLVARLPVCTVAEIGAMQERLRGLAPEQYFYPASDLHLTLLEICSGRSRQEAESIAARILAAGDLTAAGEPPTLAQPLAVCDPVACALNFVPQSPALLDVRRRLTLELARRGVEVDSRHPAQAAHVVFLRYRAPLSPSRDAWVRALASLRPRQDLTWTIREAWLTWGPAWYGMASRLSVAGPFELGERTVGRSLSLTEARA